MSNPTSPYPEIQQGYLRIILAARRYLYIETPYFLPTEPVLFALKTAAQSGVDVRILVPRRSDARFVEWASRSYLREAVEAGARVSLYEAGFLHSKLMVADDAVSTCGSVNVDFRSFENNFEANMFFYGEQTALQMRRVFEADETCAVNMADQPQLMNPRFLVRLWESFVRLLSPLM
jgi:cardiolipin synthase